MRYTAGLIVFRANLISPLISFVFNKSNEQISVKLLISDYNFLCPVPYSLNNL